MIKVYVSRFNSETDKEPHLECYEIEETLMRNTMQILVLEAPVERDNADPAEYCLKEMGL